MEKHLAYISIGSNMGDRRANCKKGIDALVSSGRAVLKGRSRFYETEPVDYRDQDWFFNAAILVETDLAPEALLDTLKQIEKDAGRKAHAVRFGPRVLDLDIILYGCLVMDTSGLTIPHPRMHERRFVLKPICDIDPNVIHPVLNRPAWQLLAALADDGQQRVVDL